MTLAVYCTTIRCYGERTSFPFLSRGFTAGMLTDQVRRRSAALYQQGMRLRVAGSRRGSAARVARERAGSWPALLRAAAARGRARVHPRELLEASGVRPRPLRKVMTAPAGGDSRRCPTESGSSRSRSGSQNQRTVSIASRVSQIPGFSFRYSSTAFAASRWPVSFQWGSCSKYIPEILFSILPP